MVMIIIIMTGRRAIVHLDKWLFFLRDLILWQNSFFFDKPMPLKVEMEIENNHHYRSSMMMTAVVNGFLDISHIYHDVDITTNHQVHVDFQSIPSEYLLYEIPIHLRHQLYYYTKQQQVAWSKEKKMLNWSSINVHSYHYHHTVLDLFRTTMRWRIMSVSPSVLAKERTKERIICTLTRIREREGEREEEHDNAKTLTIITRTNREWRMTKEQSLVRSIRWK